MLAIAALAVGLATPSPAIPAPVEIYRSALTRLATMAQPAYIDTVQRWKVLATSNTGSSAYGFDERVLFDSSARRECVLTLPYSSSSPVIIGPSYFAPDMWLVHHESAAKPLPQRSGFTPDLSDLHVIASVVSVAKPSYAIELKGVDAMNNGGGNAYHLILHPLSDPYKHNLRELWVNTKTYGIVRAVLEGDYRPDPYALIERITVAEDFGTVGPYWIVFHHAWTYHDAAAGVDFQYDATATNVSYPAAIPRWYFDERAFKQNRAQVNLTGSW